MHASANLTDCGLDWKAYRLGRAFNHFRYSVVRARLLKTQEAAKECVSAFRSLKACVSADGLGRWLEKLESTFIPDPGDPDTYLQDIDEHFDPASDLDWIDPPANAKEAIGLLEQTFDSALVGILVAAGKWLLENQVRVGGEENSAEIREESYRLGMLIDCLIHPALQFESISATFGWRESLALITVGDFWTETLLPDKTSPKFRVLDWRENSLVRLEESTLVSGDLSGVPESRSAVSSVLRDSVTRTTRVLADRWCFPKDLTSVMPRYLKQLADLGFLYSAMLRRITSESRQFERCLKLRAEQVTLLGSEQKQLHAQFQTQLKSTSKSDPSSFVQSDAQQNVKHRADNSRDRIVPAHSVLVFDDDSRWHEETVNAICGHLSTWRGHIFDCDADAFEAELRDLTTAPLSSCVSFIESIEKSLREPSPVSVVAITDESDDTAGDSATEDAGGDSSETPPKSEGEGEAKGEEYADEAYQPINHEKSPAVDAAPYDPGQLLEEHLRKTSNLDAEGFCSRPKLAETLNIKPGSITRYMQEFGIHDAQHGKNKTPRELPESFRHLSPTSLVQRARGKLWYKVPEAVQIALSTELADFVLKQANQAIAQK